PGVTETIASGQMYPDYDSHCAIMSLPHMFATSLETVPANIPYLFADPQLVEEWRPKVEAHARAGALRVGLVWAGNPTQPADARRSTTLASLAPLADVDGVTFFSLQVGGAAAAQAKSPPTNMDLVDLTGEVTDFADTAALIEHLDLVIT